MGGNLFPMLVFAIFTGLFAIEQTRVEASLPAQKEVAAINDGQQFIKYRDAVAAYQQANPAFIGSVPSATIIAQGYQFSANFLTTANNNITQIGAGAGRTITAYASLSPGSITTALQITDNDASLGIATGLNWTSYAQGAINTPQLLSTPVTNGYAVSVIQKG